MIRRRGCRAVLATVFGALGFLVATPLQAQNTGNVFGPVVDAGERSAELRIAYDADAERWAERLHVQSSLSGAVRLRAIVQTRHGPGRDLELDYVQGQLLWQITPDGQGWQSGLRTDVQLRAQGRPDRLRLGWSNQFDLGGGTRARVVVMAGREFGDGRAPGLLLETRESLSFKAGERLRLEVQHFGQYGTTANILDFRDQSHQLGPQLSWAVGDGLDLGLRALVGLTDATPDTEFMLSLGTDF